MVVNIMQNWNYKHSSHNGNIKCVGSIIKCIDFESIYHAINFDAISSFMVFSDFDYMFISMYY